MLMYLKCNHVQIQIYFIMVTFQKPCNFLINNTYVIWKTRVRSEEGIVKLRVFKRMLVQVSTLRTETCLLAFLLLCRKITRLEIYFTILGNFKVLRSVLHVENEQMNTTNEFVHSFNKYLSSTQYGWGNVLGIEHAEMKQSNQARSHGADILMAVVILRAGKQSNN